MSVRRLAVIAVIAVAGCSKVHEQRSFDVEAGASHSLEITAPLSQQTVKIVATSDQPVNVWVLLDKNLGETKDDINPEKLTEGVLAKELKTKECTLTATIPGKEKYRVFVNGASTKASVTVKIDSQ
jgi:hypothetical protein